AASDYFRVFAWLPPSPERPGLTAAEIACAEPFRSLLPDGGRGRGEIPRRGFPGAAAGRIRALRGHRHADPARRAEILERRSAGSLHLARGRAAAPRFQPSEALTKVQAVARTRAICSRNRLRNPTSSSNTSVTGNARDRAASCAASSSPSIRAR